MRSGLRWLTLLWLCLSSCAALGARQPTHTRDDQRMGKVLFLGSSTVFFWSHTGNLAGDFPLARTVNLGAGGTDYKYLIENAPAWAAQHPDATQVVIYSGDNDVANGGSPTQIAQNFQWVAEVLHQKIPRAELHVISVKPTLAPDRVDKLAVVDKANDALETMAKRLGYVTFIDVNTAMYGEDGKPRRELLGPDLLHMDRLGYGLWREFVGPTVSRCGEHGAAMSQLARNADEVYHLTFKKPALATAPAQARAVVRKAGALVEQACADQEKLAEAAHRAAILRDEGDGQAGSFENAASLVNDTLERSRVARDRIQKGYRDVTGDVHRFGTWGYGQATSAKGPKDEQAQLRREAVGGRRLAAQAARKLLSVDFELSRMADRLREHGEELLARWEKLGGAGDGVKLARAKAEFSRLQAEHGKLDSARESAARH